ncbi:uncharacterized protein EDB91DRAFT_1332260, partial [Suillus paluster]|uniref:uncharacterized protein n=1 Tax=Suillus paluster TaxID=48578 RepID=UPI001B87F5EC
MYMKRAELMDVRDQGGTLVYEAALGGHWNKNGLHAKNRISTLIREEEGLECSIILLDGLALAIPLSALAPSPKPEHRLSQVPWGRSYDVDHLTLYYALKNGFDREEIQCSEYIYDTTLRTLLVPSRDIRYYPQDTFRIVSTSKICASLCIKGATFSDSMGFSPTAAVLEMHTGSSSGCFQDTFAIFQSGYEDRCADVTCKFRSSEGLHDIVRLQWKFRVELMYHT